jgi:DNA-binding transcriptional ArsR family regulator
MAAKKDKGGIEGLRMDVQALADAFWKFRDAVLTDVAVHQAEQQQSSQTQAASGEWNTPDEAQVQRAASLMSALSQPQRLQIVLMLAEAPTSVAAVVDSLGLKTTGAAYHHLNVLMNLGLAVQPERGSFALALEAAREVQELLVALFGKAPSAITPEEGSKKKKKSASS